MKKIFTLFCLLSVNYLLIAQVNTSLETRKSEFQKAKEMFISGNYVGAQDILRKYISNENHASYKTIEESNYIIAASSFYRQDSDCLNLLENFIKVYPETIHYNEICFFIGSTYFEKKDFNLVNEWFEKVNIDYLTIKEQEDFTFKKASLFIDENKKEEAKRLFSLLSQNSDRYKILSNYYLAQIDYSEKNYNNAFKIFDELINNSDVIKNNPEIIENINFYYAEYAFLNKDFDKSISLFNKFLETYPSSTLYPEVNRILGNINYRQGKTSEAIKYYQEYISKVEKPLRGDAYFLALSYFDSKQYDEALKMFQYATGEEDKLSQIAQLQIGICYLKLNEKQKSQMAFEAASRMDFDIKTKETAMFNYALLLHETNFSIFNESVTLFEKFLKDYPKSQYTSRVNQILSETFLTSKDYNASLKVIDRIKNPSNKILEAKQAILFQIASQYFVDEDIDNAIVYFSKSIDLGNYNLNVKNNSYYWRGESYYRIKNYDNAINDYKTFFSNTDLSNENFAAGWYSLGYSYFNQTKYKDALEAFSKYLSVADKSNKNQYYDACTRIGDCYYSNRDFVESEKYYSIVESANSSYADYATFQKSFIYGLRSKYNEKINTLNKLMTDYPNSQYYSDAMYEKSRALTMIGKEKDAINVLENLIDKYPESQFAANAGIQLGQLYYNSNNYDKSISAYKDVIKKFSETQYAKTALLSLETVYRDKNDISSYAKYANSLPGGIKITTSRQDSLTYLSAEGAYLKGSKENASVYFQNYLKEYPNGSYKGDAYYYLALLQVEKGDKNKALEYYRNVIKNNSKFIENALLYTSSYEYKNNNYKQALEDYYNLEKISQSQDNKQKAQLGIARIYFNQNKNKETISYTNKLIQSLKISPAILSECKYMRGKSFANIKEVDKAIDDFKSISKDTRNVYGAEAQFILANTYYSLKSYDKAEAQVKEFMKQGTPHQYWLAKSLIILSDTYKQKGDKFQANQYIQSLKANYKGKEKDIQQMINERINNK